MENEEPDDRSDNRSCNKEHEGIPGKVPDALSQPFGPDTEQKEEEGEKDTEDEPQLGLHFADLDLKDVETSGGHLHVLHRQNLNSFGLFGCGVVRIWVLQAQRDNAVHCPKADEAHDELARVLDRVKTIERLVGVHGWAQLENLFFVGHDGVMELGPNDVLAVDGNAFAILLKHQLCASQLESETGEELGHSDGFSPHLLYLCLVLLLGILLGFLLFLPLLCQLPLLLSQLDCLLLLRHRNKDFKLLQLRISLSATVNLGLI